MIVDFEITDICPSCKEHCSPLSEYQANGFDDKEQYYNFLANEYNNSYEAIRNLSDFLGEDEDFDMLVTYLTGDTKND